MSKETTEKPKHSIDVIVYQLELQSKAIEELKDSLKGNVTTRTLATAFGIFIALWGAFGWIIYDRNDKSNQLLKVEILAEADKQTDKKLEGMRSGFVNRGGR